MPDFEDEDELVLCSVTPILCYDPLGRSLRTDLLRLNWRFSRMRLRDLKQPSTLLRLFAIMAIFGTLGVVGGMWLKIRALMVVGLILGTPLLLGAVAALLIGLPLGIWARRTESRREKPWR